MITPQAMNPCLPSYEYLTQADAHVFDERIYLYGAHAKYNKKAGKTTEIVCWSADVSHLDAWKYEGLVFKCRDVSLTSGVTRPSFLASPCVCAFGDKYYLFFDLGNSLTIGVAVCDTPAGDFRFLGTVRKPNGEKTEPLRAPSVYTDGTEIYLCAEAPVIHKKKVVENRIGIIALNPGTFTQKGDMKIVTLREKQTAEGETSLRPFGGAPSLKKFGGRYYIVYRSDRDYEICYAVSFKPTDGYTFGGVLLSTADIGVHGNTMPMNYYAATRGCIEKIQNKYFLFYQRETNRYNGNGQVCAEELRMWDGKLPRVKVTSGGLNGRVLRGIGEYKARIACLMYSQKGAKEYTDKKMHKGGHPYLEQKGRDRNHTPSQHIANVRHGATIGFRYFRFDGANQIIVTIKGDPKGRLIVSDSPEGKPVARMRLTPCKDFTDFYAPLRIPAGRRALYFTYEGTGKFIFKGFTLQQVSRGNKG